MSNCKPRIMDCLNAVDQFLEDRCNCSNHHHSCDREDCFRPCRPNRPCFDCDDDFRPCRPNRPCCDCDDDFRPRRPNRPCCNCDAENIFTPCRRTRPCCCNDCCCNQDCCQDQENLFTPVKDRCSHHQNCDSTCQSCGNSFEALLCSLIGKKVAIGLGTKCGIVRILDVQGKSVRAMVVGSGKIILINSDNIVQIREIC